MAYSFVKDHVRFGVIFCFHAQDRKIKARNSDNLCAICSALGDVMSLLNVTVRVYTCAGTGIRKKRTAE
jgi:hypothetical protein